MKLLSNNKLYLGLFGKIKDSEGVEILPPSFTLEPAGTVIAITKVDKDVFSVDVITPEHTFLLGETVSLKQVDFDIKCIIVAVGHNNYKVQPLFDNIGYDYDDSEPIIPDGVTEVYRELDVIIPLTLEDGRYYTEYGEMLLVSNTFSHLSSINIDNLYSLKPELRGKGISDWELANLLRLAESFVMEDIAGYEYNDDERFKYIDIGTITKLILYKAISIYEASYPNENGQFGYIYGRKYKSKLNGFTPYSRIDDNGIITKAKKKGLKW